MGRPELGTKCNCTACGERFYDLNRAPATCPKCSAEQPAQKAQSVWPVRGAAASRRSYRPPAQAVADEDPAPLSAVEDVEEDEDEADEAVADPDDDDGAQVDDGEHVIDRNHDTAPD